MLETEQQPEDGAKEDKSIGEHNEKVPNKGFHSVVTSLERFV